MSLEEEEGEEVIYVSPPLCQTLVFTAFRWLVAVSVRFSSLALKRRRSVRAGLAAILRPSLARLTLRAQFLCATLIQEQKEQPPSIGQQGMLCSTLPLYSVHCYGTTAQSGTRAVRSLPDWINCFVAPVFSAGLSDNYIMQSSALSRMAAIAAVMCLLSFGASWSPLSAVSAQNVAFTAYSDLTCTVQTNTYSAQTAANGQCIQAQAVTTKSQKQYCGNGQYLTYTYYDTACTQLSSILYSPVGVCTQYSPGDSSAYIATCPAGATAPPITCKCKRMHTSLVLVFGMC